MYFSLGLYLSRERTKNTTIHQDEIVEWSEFSSISQLSNKRRENYAYVLPRRVRIFNMHVDTCDEIPKSANEMNWVGRGDIRESSRVPVV